MIPLLGTVVLGILGLRFTWAQFEITNTRQDADSADKARETKEQVLTDYGKTISELMTKNKEGTDEEHIPNNSKRNIARGQTLIALRRLNPDENEIDHESKVDTGELKGLLIRYLYELHLIDTYERNKEGKKVFDRADIDLRGADIDHSVLEDAWLPDIDLTGAWLRNGNFRNADLPRANLTNVKLTNTDFTNANLTNADLRFASLTDANLSEADLKGACYVEGTEAKYFPSGFEPQKHNMVAIPKEESDPRKSSFKRCPTR